MITLEKRTAVPQWLRYATPLLAIGITVLLGGVIFAVLGYDALTALSVFFLSPLSRADQVADLFVKACPLIIIGTGLVFCYRANIWNIGAEGQLVLGALGAGWVALSFPDATSYSILILMALAAMAAGALWALIPAVLRVRFSTNEILVSLMLTYVASLLIDWLVRGPWRDPMSFGFPLTPLYADAALIPPIILPVVGRIGQLHWGVPLALLIAVIAGIVMRRTLAGYQVRLFGEAPRAAKFAGFSPSKVTIAVMMVSGALAGLAGAVEVSANIGQLQPNISFGFGFTAIIVAFLARLNPMAVILAGLVVALAELGGDAAQISLGVPKVVTGLFKGLLLFMLLAGETWTNFKISFGRKS